MKEKRTRKRKLSYIEGEVSTKPIVTLLSTWLKRRDRNHVGSDYNRALTRCISELTTVLNTQQKEPEDNEERSSD